MTSKQLEPNLALPPENALGSGRGDAHRPRSRLRAIGAWILPALLSVAVILPLRSAIGDWNDVPSGSMWPTILEGDRIFVDKLAYGLRLPFTMFWIREGKAPERGDIITFASPEDGSRLVKRIVGIPGDRIAMHENHLRVNGEPVPYADLDERDFHADTYDRVLRMVVATERLPGREHGVAFTPDVIGRRTFEEIVVPEGHYFFLGDNRDQSFDSRFMGFVRRQEIYGRVTHVALSVDPDHAYLPRFERWFTRLH
jgi:signal peptidase I